MSEIEAIKIIMDSYQKGRITECIINNQLDGAEKLKAPNMEALIEALTIISSKHNREEIIKEIESSSCNLEISLEDIARSILENEVILDSRLLKIVLCRVWKNVIDLDTVDKPPREEYDYTKRYWFGASKTFERKYTSKLQKVAYNEFGVSNILNTRDEEPYHTAKVLGESVARANKSVTELPEVVLDDPIFLYHYICQSPLTYEDGEKIYDLQDKWSVYPENVEGFADFVFTAQQELEEYRNGISVARPNEILARIIIKQYIQDLQQRGDIVFEGLPLLKDPIEGEDIHVGGGMNYYLNDVKYILNGKEYIVKCYYHGSGSVMAPDYKIPIDRAMIGIKISDKEDEMDIICSRDVSKAGDSVMCCIDDKMYDIDSGFFISDKSLKMIQHGKYVTEEEWAEFSKNMISPSDIETIYRLIVEKTRFQFPTGEKKRNGNIEITGWGKDDRPTNINFEEVVLPERIAEGVNATKIESLRAENPAPEFIF